MKKRTTSKTKRRREPTGVSLFPFLAVLICTMGVLILLLVIFTHQARLQAASEALKKGKTEAARTARENEDLQKRIKLLRLSRKTAEQRLEETRLRLGIIEDHSRRLAKKFSELQKAKEQFKQASHDRSLQQIEVELAETKDNIEQIEADIEKTQREIKRQSRSFRPVIPYEGPNGTMRIPICVECRGDAIILQPEGIELTAEDFQGPLGPQNPLAAALRAAREHLLSSLRDGVIATEIDRIEPYPLLLVRPDGTSSYDCARQALKSWGPDFGYELIESDWKIDYGSPRPALAQAMQEAINEARAMQARLASAAPRHYPQDVIGLSPTRRYTTSASGGVTAYRGALRKSCYRTPGQRLAERQSIADDSAAPHTTNVNGTGGGYKSATGTSNAAGNGANAEIGLGGGNSALGKPYSPNQTTLEDTGNSSYCSNNTGNSNADDSDGGIHRSGVNRSGDNRSSTSSNRTDSGDPTSKGNEQAGPGTAGQFGVGQNEAAQMPTGMQFHLGEKPQNKVSPGLTMSEDTPNDAQRPGEWRPSDPRHRSAKLEKSATGDDKTPRHKPGNLAKARGPNWGLPDSTPRSTPLPRPILIKCHADRLVLVPERGLSGRQQVILDGSTESAIDEFVAAVWHYMDKSWGIAGNRMYWKPILKIQVAPDAEARFDELKTLLTDSGLEVQRQNNPLRR